MMGYRVKVAAENKEAEATKSSSALGSPDDSSNDRKLKQDADQEAQLGSDTGAPDVDPNTEDENEADRIQVGRGAFKLVKTCKRKKSKSDEESGEIRQMMFEALTMMEWQRYQQHVIASSYGGDDTNSAASMSSMSTSATQSSAAAYVFKSASLQEQLQHHQRQRDETGGVASPSIDDLDAQVMKIKSRTIHQKKKTRSTSLTQAPNKDTYVVHEGEQEEEENDNNDPVCLVDNKEGKREDDLEENHFNLGGHFPEFKAVTEKKRHGLLQSPRMVMVAAFVLLLFICCLGYFVYMLVYGKSILEEVFAPKNGNEIDNNHEDKDNSVAAKTTPQPSSLVQYPGASVTLSPTTSPSSRNGSVGPLVHDGPTLSTTLSPTTSSNDIVDDNDERRHDNAGVDDRFDDDDLVVDDNGERRHDKAGVDDDRLDDDDDDDDVVVTFVNVVPAEEGEQEISREKSGEVACLLSSAELYEAVDSYLMDDSSNSVTARRYGNPIGSWCFGQRVSDMSFLFDAAERNPNASSFDEDLSGWNTARVRDMSGMFRGSSAFKGRGISGWDTSNVVSMEGMFFGASAMDSDLSAWNVSAVRDMSQMFQEAYAFNHPLDSWDVSAVMTTEEMFRYATSFNQSLSSWDVSSVTDMDYMFRKARSFNQDISAWNVSQVRRTKGMFREMETFNQDLSKWNLWRVENMNYMFRSSFQFDQNLCNWLAYTDGSRRVLVTNMFTDTACPGGETPDTINGTHFCRRCKTPR